MSSKSMVRLLADAKRAYAIVLNAHCKGATTRYAIYVETENGLLPLWPKENEKLLLNQVYSTLKQYPAFHFVVSGYQFNHLSEMKRALKRYNPEIELTCLRGWFPSDH